MMASVVAAMTLGELLGPAAGAHASVAVTDLVSDSRQVTPGAAFVALAGESRHGLDFAADAEIVIIYCNGGECEDSIQAARYLTEEIDDPLPFEIVHVFEGGIQAWFEAGYDRDPENCKP